MQVCLSRVFTVPRGRLLCYIWSYMGSWLFPGSPLTHKTWFKICSSLGNAARTERKSLRIIMRENKPAQFFWTNKMAVCRLQKQSFNSDISKVRQQCQCSYFALGLPVVKHNEDGNGNRFHHQIYYSPRAVHFFVYFFAVTARLRHEIPSTDVLWRTQTR